MSNSLRKSYLLSHEREFLRREIAQRMDRPACALQAPQERDIFLDRPAERLDPPLVEQPQFVGEFRKGLRPRLDRFGEIRDDVGMRDEVHGRGGREKVLHPRLVLERLAVEIARIPAQQNVADVKDDDQGEGLLRDIGLRQACPAPRRSQAAAGQDLTLV